MVDIVFYMDDRGGVPVLAWILGQQQKVQDKCFAKILRLMELGHNLRRPEADSIGNGLYELRIVQTGRHYRILYFFHGRQAVILTRAFRKGTDKVPHSEIDIALAWRKKYEASPAKHTYAFPV